MVARGRKYGADIQERVVATTKSFKSGNSVAVRLPREMGVAAGIEIELEKEGDVIHLRPKRRAIDVSAFLPGVPGLAELWREYEASGGRELDARALDWTALKERFPPKP